MNKPVVANDGADEDESLILAGCGSAALEGSESRVKSIIFLSFEKGRDSSILS